jgi:hypothetical protein
LERLALTAFGCFAIGVAGMMTMLEPLSHGPHWVALVVATIAIAFGIYLRRFRASRLIADAWLAGVVGVGVLAAVLIAAT